MWTLQDLSTICWSLAKLNIGNRKLLDLIYNRIVVDIPVLSAKDISYQLWGFAVLGYPLQSQVLATYWVSQPTLLPYCCHRPTLHISMAVRHIHMDHQILLNTQLASGSMSMCR